VNDPWHGGCSATNGRIETKGEINMKHARSVGAIAVLMLTIAMPSMARAQYHEERLDKFLDEHQNLRSELGRNPNLIYDKRYREQHPELQDFMQHHPNVWGKLPDNNRWGAYDPDHNWHESDWWHDHDRDWMYKNHPEWAENHPDWRDNDGDYDDSHVWHARKWWNDHRPDWVEKHHPDWYKHREHEEAAEQAHPQNNENNEASQQQGQGHKHGHHGNGNGNGNQGQPGHD
jgi:hypothetical protein